MHYYYYYNIFNIQHETMPTTYHVHTTILDIVYTIHLYYAVPTIFAPRVAWYNNNNNNININNKNKNDNGNAAMCGDRRAMYQSVNHIVIIIRTSTPVR